MFYTVQPLFEINEEGYSRILKYMHDRMGIPSGVIQVIEFLVENKYESAEEIFHKSLSKISQAKESLSGSNGVSSLDDDFTLPKKILNLKLRLLLKLFLNRQT